MENHVKGNTFSSTARVTGERDLLLTVIYQVKSKV